MKIDDSIKLAIALVVTAVVTGGAGLYFAGVWRTPADILEQQARDYVVLALELDRVKDGEVDAWFGPPELADQAQRRQVGLDDILADATTLATEVRTATDPGTASRRQALATRIDHLAAVTALAGGTDKPAFADELEQLYGLSLPAGGTDYSLILQELDALLPGRGSLAFRIASFRNKLVVPADRRQAVFEAALAACRRRTLAHWQLPADESLAVEWTRDVQAAWHEYLGGNRSRLRINPLTVALVSQAVDLACHEGYPGHHAQFVLLDNAGELPVESTVVLLRSAGSVLREGAANYGIDLAFPAGERLAFERDVLFPLAGLAPELADTNLRIHRLVTRLSGAAVPVIRDYYDGAIDFNTASFRLEREAMMASPLAVLEFVNDYGAYSMGYTLVRSLLTRYSPAAGDDWATLETLLVQPPEHSLQVLQGQSARW